MKKLAVIIGCQGERLDETHKSILFLLKLFGVEFDMYICTDERYMKDWEKYFSPYIKEMKSFESSKPREDVNAKKMMGGSYYQWKKLMHARDMIDQPDQYGAIIKLRNDTCFNYQELLKSYGAESTDLTALMKIFETVFNTISLNISKIGLVVGDKIAMSDTRHMLKWSNLYRNRHSLSELTSHYTPVNIPGNLSTFPAEIKHMAWPLDAAPGASFYREWVLENLPQIIKKFDCTLSREQSFTFTGRFHDNAFQLGSDKISVLNFWLCKTDHSDQTGIFKHSGLNRLYVEGHYHHSFNPSMLEHEQQFHKHIL